MSMGHPLFSLTSTTLTKRLAMDTHVKLWQAATARAAAVSSADSPSMSPAKGEAKRGRAAAATGATAAAAEPKLLSIPLIPHAVHKRRRLLEIMSSSPEWATTSTASATLFSNATTASDALGREELLESMLLGHDAQHLARPRRYPLERQRNRRRRLNTATLSVDQGDGSSENQQSEPQQSAHTQSTTTGTKPNQVLSLYQGFGTHYADIWVGSPPQRQTLIVDTGSATTAFACSGCSPRRCGRLDRYHTDPLFDERKSSTFRKIGCSECFLGECVDTEHGVADQCDFGVAYQEGSNWTAFEAVDRCYVGGWHNKAVSSRDGTTVQNVSSNAALSPLSLSNHDGSDPHRAALDYSFDLRFGCQTQMTGPFRTQLADGIMGMDIGKPAIWNQMYLQNAIATRAFSLCFSRQTDARRSGTQAGALTFGGTDVRLHAHNHVMVYSATNFDGAGFFSVQLHQIYLRHSSGGESVVSSSSSSLDNTQQALVIPLNVAENLMNHGEIIIDSGTTDTYFVHHLRKPFQKAWKEMVGTTYTNDAVALTDDEMHKLPTILLQFKGHSSNTDIVDANLGDKQLPLAATLDPDNAMDVLVAIPPSHYMEYQPAKKMYVPGIYFEEADGSVLGANVMMYHDILFDVEQGRIGWVESTCDYANLVAPFTGGTTSPSKGTQTVVQTKEKPQLRARSSDATTTAASATAQAIPSVDALAVGARPGSFLTSSQAGFCSSFECRLSILLLSVVALVVAMWTTSRKRKRIRVQRSGLINPSLAPASTGSSLTSLTTSAATAAPHSATTSKLLIFPAPVNGTSFLRPMSLSESDDEISVPSRDRERRGNVLRSRSYKPATLSLSDEESPFPAVTAGRAKGFSRKSVLRSRSTQVVI